jgi:hypothetical protein
VDVRQDICDYLKGHGSFFSLFLDLDDDQTKGEDAADFDEYVADMRQDGEWGGNLELVAAARLYQRRIRVFSGNMAAMNIDYDSSESPHGPELLVSYHDNDHYNSVRDTTRRGKPPVPKKTYPTSTDQMTEEDEYEDDIRTSDTESPTISGTDDVLSDLPENEVIQHDEDGECIEVTLPSNNNLNETRQRKKAKTTTIKANALCPCGSNLKYKKCCKGKDRREAVLRSSKEKKVSDKDNLPGDNAMDEDAIRQPAMEGKFRVLTI